jgi:hypothetical protein
MTSIVRISMEDDEALQSEVEQAFEAAGIEIQPGVLRTRGIPSPTDIATIIVALGSAGAFTTLYQTIVKLLEKNKDREVTIEGAGTKICLKGHSFPEEMELLQKVAPELL